MEKTSEWKLKVFMLPMRFIGIVCNLSLLLVNINMHSMHCNLHPTITINPLIGETKQTSQAIEISDNDLMQQIETKLFN